MKKEIDLSSLITLIHFKYLDIKVKKNINDYVNYIYLVQSLNIINKMIVGLLVKYIENYHFDIKPDEKNNVIIKAKFHFNIGIILINLFIINRRYKHVQSTNK